MKRKRIRTCGPAPLKRAAGISRRNDASDTWRRDTTQSLRLAFIDFGDNDLVYAAACGREGLCAAQLDPLDDFDILLMAQVLNNIVH